MREISLFLHILGVILWIGGCASAAFTAAQLMGTSSAARAEGLSSVRRTLQVVATPGLLLAWLGGLTMFVTFFDVYARAGWMHGKLTIAILLSAMHGILLARVRRAQSQESGSASGFAGLAIALVMGAALVVALVVFRPGA
jgi:putative membrane protein